MSRGTKGVSAADAPSVFDRRILRRVRLSEGSTGLGDPSLPNSIACVVDIETTGLTLNDDGIIQFAARRVHFDPDGVITLIEPAMVWHEDPGKPIPPEISRLTGITDRHVLDERIDEDEVLDLMIDVDIVIAHSAQFDKPFLVRRLAPLGDMLWGCSCVDVDWARNGFDGRALGWLCAQAGWFFDGHRALADVDAVVTLLAHQSNGGNTILSELVANALEPQLLVEATGASFHTKELLRARGYRWDASKRVWARHVREAECMSEESWLASNIYGSGCGARAFGPLISAVRSSDRFM